jgi:hypothetical protein
LGFGFLKTRCGAAKPNVRARRKGGKLSDPPDFGRGVLDAPVCVRLVRVSASGGQVAGRPFFWYFSLSAKEKYEQKIFKFYLYPFFGRQITGTKTAY